MNRTHTYMLQELIIARKLFSRKAVEKVYERWGDYSLLFFSCARDAQKITQTSHEPTVMQTINLQSNRRIQVFYTNI